MKPEPWRLDPTGYAHLYEMELRFGDLDPLGHLNNVAAGRFYEEGRVRFTREFGARSMWSGGGRVLVVRVAVDYLAEGHHPDPLTVATGVLRLGSSSYTFGQLLLQQGKPIGLAESVLVYTAGGKAQPMPEPLREAMAARLIAGAETTT